MNIRFLIKASIIAGFIMLSLPSKANDLKHRQSELKSIQAQINQQKSAVNNTNHQRGKLLALLKKDEQAIAAAAKKINTTKKELEATNKQLSKLEAERQKIDEQKRHQQESLASQLASAYLSGNHDYTKMLLNQQSPAKIERLLTYYQYLNNARIESIKALQTTIADLKAIKEKQNNHQIQLNKLILEQQQQAKSLKDEQAQRQKTLVQLQRTLHSRGAKLEQLQIEEVNLKRVIDNAMQSMNTNVSYAGLSSRHKLKWPTAGKIRSGFGSQRSGKLRWKGVTIAAQEGQSIASIASGKVLYADWLRGFGLVLVVDHGKGYMTLYGHAQALLKKAGDKVAKGETIALVGRSGGQAKAGLYFEVRHKGKAVDPAKYCKR